MGFLCFGDAYCLYWVVIAVLVAVYNIFSTMQMQETWSNYDGCSGSSYYGYSSSTNTGCQSALDSLKSAISLSIPFRIIGLVCLLIEVCVCGLLTKKTNEAQTALNQGKVFVGMPAPQAVAKPCVIGTPVQPAQPGEAPYGISV